MSDLREGMIEEMELRAFLPATHRPYLRAARELERYCGRSPETLTAEEVRGYLLHLMKERRLHLSTINGIATALRFLYSVVLKRPEIALAIPPQKTPKPLPDVLSVEEIERLFAATPNIK